MAISTISKQAGSSNTEEWVIDPNHSSVEFSVKHMMFTTVRGRFKALSGVIHVDEQNPDRSHVEVEIDAKSLDTGVLERDNHLRSADFLDAEKHPKIIFRSRRVEGAYGTEGDRFTIYGDLEIRGTTLEVPLQVVFDGRGIDPWKKQRSGFTAKGQIDRRDWGLKWNQALETGGILVGNEVKLELEVQAVKQEAIQKASA